MKTQDPMTSQNTTRGTVARVRAFVARHAVASGVMLAAGVAVAIFVLVYFQPQKLFIDDRIDEALPAASAEPTAATSGATTSAPVVVGSGAFRSLAHATSGTAKLVTLADGSAYIRLEGFRTENGPDLFVYLSPNDGSARDDDELAAGALNLGKLKGNIGDQNYLIPAGTDLSKYNSVLIWCKRFTTGFGVAPLTR